MQKKKKRIFAVLLSAILVVVLTGCSKLGSIINEIHGSLIGNNYTVYTYDNYGNQTLKTSGKKISITGNKIETVSYDSDGRAVTGYDLSSVITITIDGKEIESCGDTCVFVQSGLEPEVDFSLDEVNSNGGNGITDNAGLGRGLNRDKMISANPGLWSSNPSLDSLSPHFPETMSIGKFRTICRK